MMDTAKKAFFAAVGAPVVVGREVGDRAMQLNSRVIELRTKLRDDAQKRFDTYATEGRKMVDQVQDQKVVEDLTARVDFDQIQEQVGKLRGQLEDMVSTWRDAFLPEEERVEKVKVEVEAEVTKPAAKPAATKPAAKTAAKKPAAKTSTAKKPAAKTAAKKTAAKKPAAKSTAAKKPAAKTSTAKKSTSKAAPKKAAASTKK